MTPDELRALADALEPMARAPRFEDFDVPVFCAWMRACADAKPVAWRDHVEQRIRGWRQRTMNRSGDRLALDDMMGQESIDDLIDYVCDEWAAPAVPQAEPKREPLGDWRIAEEVKNRQIYGDGADAFYEGVRWAEHSHGIGGSDAE